MRRSVVLATDSAEPSGVGRMMLTLAAALPPEWDARLLFADHAAGRRLVAEAMAAGSTAAVVAPEAWGRAFAAATVVNIHAGIGWEGHALCAAARASGAAVVRTEHLPWLLTDAGQIADYANHAGNLDALITVSEASAQSWRPHTHLPVHPVPNGIAASAMPRGAASSTILCVARLTLQKNHRTLIAAMARLARADMRLLITGEGPEDTALRRRIARYGLHNVEMLGQRDDIPALMAAADVLVLPSTFEGLPLVVLEAMAAGCPVIATRIGGTTEALGEGHPWLVPPSDARALAAALADALDHPDRRDAVASAQQVRFAERHTAARMGEQTAKIYARYAEKRTDPMTTRIGFIGAGGIAHRHFGVLETMEDVRIAAICDPDLPRAEEAGKRFGAAVFADHQAMLDQVELDAVFICIPPFAHGAPERACIAKRLPFFVEKPLSLDLKLAEEIAAEAEGLITAVGYHWRYLDTVDEARAQLANNPAHLMTGFWLDQTPPPQWWWREDGSGGQVVEQATHVIDLARFLAGDVTEAFGFAAHRPRNDFDGLDVPTATTASLKFASGAIANLSATCLLRWNHRTGLHVFADALALEITDHDLMVDVGRGRPVRHAEGDPVWREDRDFIDAVQGKENTIRCPYAEALETHRVALAISQSAASGAVVKMEVLRDGPQRFFREASA